MQSVGLKPSGRKYGRKAAGRLNGSVMRPESPGLTNRMEEKHESKGISNRCVLFNGF